METYEQPAVGVVIATHDRPKLVRAAINSVLGQQYDGAIEVLVVHDRSEPDNDLVRDDPQRRVSVCANTRTVGLAGARNTGILALAPEFIGFCDDDDTWLPGKLSAQIARFATAPETHFVTTAMRVEHGNRSTVRLAGKPIVTLQDMARSRMAMLHSSSFLFRRSAMLGDDGFGLVDETLPRSMAEDWDLLLRAARMRPIAHIDEPLVSVLWGATSYFNDAWADKNAAHEWLIAHYPEIRADSRAMGLFLGKLAFGHAALKERRAACRAAAAAVRANWREPRTVIALLVVAGVPTEWIITQLNRRGHGI